MRTINDGPKNEIGLDFEENLEGFIRFLNWLSVLPYAPVITVTVGMMVGVSLRLVRLKAAGGIFVMLFSLNWTCVRWLEHHFLSPAKKREPHVAWRRRLAIGRCPLTEEGRLSA